MTEETLKRLKNVELDMLRAFISCCERLGLRYYLMGGTMLGAVRHQGFVPWDDDIDVGMMRADYEVFLAKAQPLLPERYFVQCRATEPALPINFAKLRDSRTTFVEHSLKDLPINHGVYIDIFPLDGYPQDRRQQMRFDRTNRLLSLRIRNAFTLHSEQRRAAPVEALTKAASGALALRYGSVTEALEARDALYRSVAPGPLVANHCGAWGKREITPSEWFGDGVEATFEGLTVTLPQEYDKWLTQVYGDYMTPPPPAERTPHHHLERVDLDHPYTDYARGEGPEAGADR